MSIRDERRNGENSAFSKKERAIKEFYKYENTIIRIRQRMKEVGLSTTETTFERIAPTVGLSVKYSRFTKAISASHCPNRYGILKDICRDLGIHIDNEFASSRFGGYSYRENELLVGQYGMVRPCFDASDHIAVFPSQIFLNSDYGCFRIESLDERNSPCFGDISILKSGYIEFSMIENGYSFLGILHIDIEWRIQKGVLLTLGQNKQERWTPMCCPVALVKDYELPDGRPFIISPQAPDYSLMQQVLNSVRANEFVSFISKIE